MIDLRGKVGRAANPPNLRLAEALRDAGFPFEAAQAEAGRYDPETSPFPLPACVLENEVWGWEGNWPHPRHPMMREVVRDIRRHAMHQAVVKGA